MRHLLRTCSIAMLFSTMACFDCFHVKNPHPQIIQKVTLLIDLFTKLTSQNWPNNEHLWQLLFGIKCWFGPTFTFTFLCVRAFSAFFFLRLAPLALFMFFVFARFQQFFFKTSASCTVHGTWTVHQGIWIVKKEWIVIFHLFKNYFAIVFLVFSKISCI